MTYAQIIEREFRANTTANTVVVDMSEDEVIQVTADGQLWSCACESDEVFCFLKRDDSGETIRFAIPADWFSATR